MPSDRRSSGVGVALVLSAASLFLLEAALRTGLVSPLTVAAPSEIANSVPLLVEEGIGIRFLQTFGAALAATAIGCVAGLPLAWCLATRRSVDDAFRSWIAVVASAPLILLYPLFLVAFGRSFGTIVAIGVVSATPPIVLNARDGLAGVRRIYVEVANSFGLSERHILTKVMLPAAAPLILVGVRLGMVFALVNVVAVEYVINYGGVGALVGEMADRFEIGAMYGAIAAIIVASAVFYIATERVEKWLHPT